MKTRILLLLLLISTLNFFSQVTLDAEYNDGAYIIHLANSGDKICVYSKGEVGVSNTIVTLYNLDQSIFRTIDIGTADEVLNISEHLVNTDDTIELMIQDGYYGFNTTTFYIIDENLNELFRADDWKIGKIKEATGEVSSYHQDDQFIYHTSEGNKFVLKEVDGSNYRVYSLGGDPSLNVTSSRAEIVTPYPNPSAFFVKIPYKSYTNSNTIITIYNSIGQQIKRIKANNLFKEIKLDVSNYDKGTYIYNIKNSNDDIKGKFIVN